MLGLADEVGGDVLGVGAVVGEHGDLGGPGLGVDADEPLEEALGGRDVDVARPGHEADGLAGVPSSSKPYANAATAWAPPTAYTSSTPSRAHAARMVGCG